jgi:hypothetical protein
MLCAGNLILEKKGFDTNAYPVQAATAFLTAGRPEVLF